MPHPKERSVRTPDYFEGPDKCRANAQNTKKLIACHQRLNQRRQDFMNIAHDAEIGNLKDGSIGVLVDRDDVLRSLHTNHVLGRPGDATRYVDRGLDGLARLTHLMGVRKPTGINDGPTGARCTVEQFRGLFNQRVLLRLTQTASTRNDDRRLFELWTAALFEV